MARRLRATFRMDREGVFARSGAIVVPQSDGFIRGPLRAADIEGLVGAGAVEWAGDGDPEDGLIAPATPEECATPETAKPPLHRRNKTLPPGALQFASSFGDGEFFGSTGEKNKVEGGVNAWPIAYVEAHRLVNGGLASLVDEAPGDFDGDPFEDGDPPAHPLPEPVESLLSGLPAESETSQVSGEPEDAVDMGALPLDDRLAEAFRLRKTETKATIKAALELDNIPFDDAWTKDQLIAAMLQLPEGWSK